MASPKHHRKLIQPSTNITAQFSICMFQCDPQLTHAGFCLPECTIFCPSFCGSTGPSPSPANSPYAQPQPPDHHHHHRPPLLLPLKISVIFITATLVYTLYKLFRWWRRRTPPPASPENQENDVVDHPIWYIRTTGLQPSVINAIKVVKYDKVVDGSDCLVCLSEFEENDMVRLLPYCKHAFHISCIDTWLGSHTNCPLCRAGIVGNSTNVVMEMELRDDNEGGESSESRVGQTDEDENSNYSIDVDGDGDLGIELVKIKLPNK